MKSLKSLLLLCTIVLLASCTNQLADMDSGSPTSQETTLTPGTTVQMYAGTENSPQAKQNIARIAPSPEPAYYYIRLDGSLVDAIKGVSGYNANDYFPLNSNGNSIKSDKNRGTINYYYPYQYSGEREGNTWIYEYLVDSEWAQAEDALMQVPSLDDLIEANQSSKFNLQELKQKLDGKQYYIDWYVVKHQDDGWHVDGILKLQDGLQLNGEVEVDIHQQQHNNWNEIKTAIHIRDTVDVQVTLPISQTDLVEIDGIHIRDYRAYYKVDNTEYPISISIAHNYDNMTIDVTGIKASMLKKLRTNGSDGLTIEVNSYYQKKTHREIYDLLKQSTVRTYSNFSHIRGQIHSSYFPNEKVDIQDQGNEKQNTNTTTT